LNDATTRDKLVGFRVDRLPTLKDGEHAKNIENLMRITLLKQWLRDQLIRIFIFHIAL
jgi:hypothetical protein